MSYKLSLNFTEIETKLLLVRRSDKPYSETFDEFGFLKEQAIPKVEWPGMSINLLGAKFKPGDIKYIQTSSSAEPWKGESVKYADLIKNITIKEDVIPIYFWYEDMNAKSFPYERPKDQVQKLMLESLGYSATELAKSDFVKLKGTTSIEHAPTKSNYWHVELEMKHADGTLFVRKDTKKGWAGKAAQAVSDIISVKAFSDLTIGNEVYRIEKKNYLLNK
ncbi:hypothetical protein [Spirosoma endophyticum]|uniref:Uncharacterized protein n=1 Tax=Spirosoma endophyticum TaxID=662367 RepID=A0A1I2H6N7_9BACT|nr:hypothetical protein [Spirosoma endophyticum]SFF25033.1 hypothetical protein SAMN05216167_13823 [Spirosoma endophyticum]